MSKVNVQIRTLHPGEPVVRAAPRPFTLSPDTARAHANVLGKIDATINAMGAIYPNHGDHVLRGPGAHAQAVEVHRSQIARMRALHAEISNQIKPGLKPR